MTDQRIERLEERVAELERRVGVAPAAVAASPPAPTPSQTPEPGPPGVLEHDRVPAAASRVAGEPPSQAGQRSPAARPHGTDAGFSVKTSEAVLKWSGIGLVVLAVAFALGLAIERGWITPGVRVAASSVVAVLLFVAGQRIRPSRLVFAETLQGAAFVVAYLTSLSAIVMDLVDGQMGFALMVGVTLLALLTSVSLDSPPIAVLGVLGGLATPLLLESGIDDPLFLASYVPLLAVAGFGVYAWTGWRSVANATAAASWFLLSVLVIEADGAAVVAAVVAVGAMAWLVPLVRSLVEQAGRVSRRPSHVMEQTLQPLLRKTAERLAYLSPIVTIVLLLPVVELTRHQWSPYVAGTGVTFAAVAILLSNRGFEDAGYVHTTIAALLGGIGLTLALNGDVLVVALGLQAVALGMIADRLAHRPMAWQSYATLAVALLAVLFRIAERGFPGDATVAEWLAEGVVLGAAVFIGWRERSEGAREIIGFVAHLLAIGWFYSLLADPWLVVALVVLYIGAKLADGRNLLGVATSVQVNAAVLAWHVVTVGGERYFDAADYGVGTIGALALVPFVLGALAYIAPSASRFDALAAYVALLGWVVVAAGTSDALITAGWVTIGLAVLAAGVRLINDNVQLVGWLTLATATAKLLLYDLEATDPLVRIGLFFGIGLAFLALAYVLPTHLAPQVTGAGRSENDDADTSHPA